MIPKRIQPFFDITYQKSDGENNLTEGVLTCCNNHDFELFVVGNIRQGILSKMYLLPKNDTIMVEARCNKCGRVILAFDNSFEGYEKHGNNQFATKKQVVCKKCLGESYSLTIRYEYPNIQELEELGIGEVDEAFTWIWITLVCNECGTKYTNFVDYEAG